MAFGNLANYETVKQRKDKFVEEHPTGVLLAVPREVSEEQASFMVGVWFDRSSMEEGAERLSRALASGASISDAQALLLMAPDSLGTAFEAKWMTGASKTSWTENCEESAIGRALDNAGYHGNGKCSREEVLKAKEAETVIDHAEEDEFLQSYDEAKPIVASMKGKRGVRELKQFLGHCSVAGMNWDQVVEFAKGQGVDLYNGLVLTTCTKLRDLVKNERTGVSNA